MHKFLLDKVYKSRRYEMPKSIIIIVSGHEHFSRIVQLSLFILFFYLLHHFFMSTLETTLQRIENGSLKWKPSERKTQFVINAWLSSYG